LVREKLTIVVHGANQEEIRRRATRIAGEYFGVESVEELSARLDMEFDVVATEGTTESFSATAYVRIKN
jgi:hypothetical protein